MLGHPGCGSGTERDRSPQRLQPLHTPGPLRRFAQHFSSLWVPAGGRTWHRQSRGSSSAGLTGRPPPPSVPLTAHNNPSVGQASTQNPWGDRTAPSPCLMLGRTVVSCPPSLSGAGGWEQGTARGPFGANPGILHHEMVSKSLLGLLLLKLRHSLLGWEVGLVQQVWSTESHR